MNQIINEFLESAARINLVSGKGADRFSKLLKSRDRDIYQWDNIGHHVHYSELDELWDGVLNLMPGETVVLTTQSIESVQAAYRAFGDEPGEKFKYHRVDTEDGFLKLTTYSDEAFLWAVTMGDEVR